jgi:hypothetical protein
LFVRIESGCAGLDFQEYDAFTFTSTQTFEYEIIDTFAYEDHIFGAIGKIGQEWCDLLMDMSEDDGLG